MKWSRERAFFGLSLAYVLLLLACVGALGTIPYLASEPPDHAVRGCHLTGDQLVFGASCHGFRGEDAVAALLSLPFALVLLPMAALATLSEAADVLDLWRLLLATAALFLGASLWAPLIYFVAAVRRATLWERK